MHFEANLRLILTIETEIWVQAFIVLFIIKQREICCISEFINVSHLETQ